MLLTAAVPEGSAPARNQVLWLRGIEGHQDFLCLRRDSQESLLRVAWVLLREARQDMTTAPGWDGLVERTGLSRATVARWLRWLRDRGLLGVVEHGSTPQYRGRRGDPEIEGNRAAVYLLTSRTSAVTSADAPGDEHETPSLGKEPSVGGSSSRAHTREASPLRGPDHAPRCPNPAGDEHETPSDLGKWSRTRATKTRSDELRAAQTLRQASLDLRPLTARHVRSLVRPWLRAGWTVADLLHAIDHDPDGTARTWTTLAHRPGGWLLHRLAPWQGHRAPSQETAASRAAARAAHEQRRQEEAAALAASTPQGRAAGLAAVRATLANRPRSRRRLA